MRTALASISADAYAIFCGHGAVGTLLKCHIGGRAIDRAEDQRRMANSGGGNGFIFDLAARKLLSDWTAMEEIKPDWFT